MKKIIVVEGLKCEKCSARLERVLNNIEGISAKVSHESKLAELELNKAYSNEELTEFIEDTGFEVIEIK